MKKKKINPSFATLVRKLNDFDKKRCWLGLDPADLAKSIVLEAAELLEHYQWDNTRSQRQWKLPVKDKKAIAYEAADVFIYLLKFCREAKIDLLQATVEKLAKSAQKYPADYAKNEGHLAYEKIKQAHRAKLNKK